MSSVITGIANINGKAQVSMSISSLDKKQYDVLGRVLENALKSYGLDVECSVTFDESMLHFNMEMRHE